jgi:hypothetical protein
MVKQKLLDYLHLLEHAHKIYRNVDKCEPIKFQIEDI